MGSHDKMSLIEDFPLIPQELYLIGYLYTHSRNDTLDVETRRYTFITKRNQFNYEWSILISLKTTLWLLTCVVCLLPLSIPAKSKRRNCIKAQNWRKMFPRFSRGHKWDYCGSGCIITHAHKVTIPVINNSICGFLAKCVVSASFWKYSWASSINDSYIWRIYVYISTRIKLGWSSGAI